MRISKIDPIKTKELCEIVEGLPLNAEDREWLRGYTFYAVDHMKGRCYHEEKIITVPTICWTEDFFWCGKHRLMGGMNLVRYYVIHEVTHALVGHRAKHGPEFMAKFQEICPVYLQHFELLYKPRNAKVAGIGEAQCS